MLTVNNKIFDIKVFSIKVFNIKILKYLIIHVKHIQKIFMNICIVNTPTMNYYSTVCIISCEDHSIIANDENIQSYLKNKVG